MRPLPGRTRHAPLWRDRERVAEAAAARSLSVQTAKAFRLQANPTMAKSRFGTRYITDYEPIKDASRETIGAYFVGYKN